MRLLSQFVEEMDLEYLYATYSRLRENQATPRQILKMVLYSYMNRNFSSRSMERSCRRDINFMYLLEGSPVPDHSTFSRFRSLHLAPCAERIMAEVSDFLYDIGEVSGDAIFLDDTKIGTCANDATFMRMKEDAMGNGQLNAGYNVQHGVDSEYIVWLTVSSNPTDTPKFIRTISGGWKT